MAGSPVCDVQIANNMVDRISELPNEVLVDILSLLTLNEAGRSSVLSKRWRNLWKMTGRLNFDGSSITSYVIHLPCDLDLRARTLDLMRSKFCTWVNEVIRLHECPSIEEFRVICDLDTSAAQDIDEWIKFMIRKSVKKADLDFSACRVDGLHAISKECRDYITSVSNLTNLMNLRSLRLSYVNIDGQLVEYFLSKCPHLEVLSVTCSETLLDLKVVGHLTLKYLECNNCFVVRSIKIEAPKLEKFVYYGNAVKFFIGSNPRLTELDLGGYRHEDVPCALVPFRSFLRQLETLTLRLDLEDFRDEVLPSSFGELSNLKHLILEFELMFDLLLHPFRKLIAAAPILAKFTVMVVPCFMHFRSYYGASKAHRRDYTSVAQPHGCLKEVEILGFKGGVADFDMAKYLVTNAVNLEKLVIDPMHPKESRHKLLKQLAKIDEDVKDLKERLPLGAQLIVADSQDGSPELDECRAGNIQSIEEESESRNGFCSSTNIDKSTIVPGRRCAKSNGCTSITDSEALQVDGLLGSFKQSDKKTCII